jgi:hypothetical protein
MFENIVVSLAVTLLAGFPLSLYAGVIVARYYAFETAVNRARSLILNMEREWGFAHLPERIPDATSPTGKRSVYVSAALSSNDLFWQLMQVALELKEQGHRRAAGIVDQVAQELDGLREDIVAKADFAVAEASFDATAHIADWHRRLSKVRPQTWLMLKPWPGKRYQHLSCVSVNENTGEWREEEPGKK